MCGITRYAPDPPVVPEGDRDLPAGPRPLVPVVNAALGGVLARAVDRLWGG